MKRRVALKQMAWAVGGLISLPAWAEGWNKESIRAASRTSFMSLSVQEEAILAEIVETFIPATDTPGAKELGVHTFIQKIVTDCFPKEAGEKLTKGLEIVDATAKQSFGKSFVEGNNAQRTQVLSGLDLAVEPEKKELYSTLKGLTIRGYMGSEYVMTNLTHYEMVPGRYHGCVPVASK